LHYYKYIAFLPAGIDRAALKQTMRERFDVGLSGEVYDTPLHLQPVFEAFADRACPARNTSAPAHLPPALPSSARATPTTSSNPLDRITEMGLQ